MVFVIHPGTRFMTSSGHVQLVRRGDRLCRAAQPQQHLSSDPPGVGYVHFGIGVDNFAHISRRCAMQPRAVWHALPNAHAYRMLIGACDLLRMSASRLQAAPAVRWCARRGTTPWRTATWRRWRPPTYNDFDINFPHLGPFLRARFCRRRPLTAVSRGRRHALIAAVCADGRTPVVSTFGAPGLAARHVQERKYQLQRHPASRHDAVHLAAAARYDRNFYTMLFGHLLRGSQLGTTSRAQLGAHGC